MVFIHDTLIDFLDDIPLVAIHDLWFEHEGVPTHFSFPERDWLDMEYPGHWTGHGGGGGLVLWPLR